MIFQHIISRAATSVLILLGALSHGTATAGDWYTVSESKKETYLDVGAAILHRNTYIGSEETDTDVLPYINGEYKGRLYFNPGTGVGVHVINNDHFRLSTGVNAVFGRSNKDIPVLNRTGEIDFSPVFQISGRYYLPLAVIDVGTNVPLGGNIDGTKTQISVATRLPLSKKFFITPGVRATHMSQGWNNTFYGVNTEQSTASGLATYNAGSEFSTLSAFALGFLELGDDYQMVGALTYNHLVGDAADSPLSLQNHGVTALLGLARTF